MIGKILNKFSKYENPFEGYIYFVNAGSHSGDFYVSVDKKEEKIILFNISKNEDRDPIIEVTDSILKSGIQNKIVELVERLPYNVYKEIKVHYDNTHSRLQ